MQWVGRVAATRAWRALSNVRQAPVLMLLALAGCTAGGQTSGLFADTHGTVVAIDSVDGPPLQVSQKLARNLHEAASSRQIAVVPREGAAPYRLRGYLAVQARAGATSIAWAWDIYTTAERRAFRLNGEEPVAGGRKSWAVVDEDALRRIAQASVEQLAAFLASPSVPPGPEATPSSIFAEKGHTLLSRIDDFSPEASGIFRIFKNKPSETASDADGFPSQASVPLPPDRPPPGPAAASALAYTDSEH